MLVGGRIELLMALSLLPSHNKGCGAAARPGGCCCLLSTVHPYVHHHHHVEPNPDPSIHLLRSLLNLSPSPPPPPLPPLSWGGRPERKGLLRRRTPLSACEMKFRCIMIIEDARTRWWWCFSSLQTEGLPQSHSSLRSANLVPLLKRIK